MNVYKITEIDENIPNYIEFSSPELCVNHYFIKCSSDMYIQLNELCFKEQFYKKTEKLLCDVYVSKEIEKHILIFDNFSHIFSYYCSQKYTLIFPLL